MKRVEPQTVGEIINKVLKESNLEDAFDEQKISYLWPQVVGTTINRQTSNRHVSNRILHVYITSASLKNEISFMRRQLTDALNKAAGKEIITDIIIH